MSHVDLRFDTDLVVENGDLVLLDHEHVDGQRVRDRLSTFRGEWFLDLLFGPDYRKNILVKNPRLDVIDAILKAEILKSLEDGGTFLDFSVSLDAARKMTISYTVDTTSGVLSDTIPIG